MKCFEQPKATEGPPAPNSHPSEECELAAQEFLFPDAFERQPDNCEDARVALAALTEIVELLPIGVTVRSGEGRLLLANSAAIEKSAGLEEVSVEDREPSAEEGEASISEFDRASTIPDIAAAVTMEEHCVGPSGERTYLTIEKQVRIRDETLLLSASLDITDRKEIEKKLLRRAFFDELTRLPNRTMVQEHVEQVIAKPGCRFALAFLDIDNFKHINDYYSHAVGDLLLMKVAQRVVENIRPTDMLARISGDEFLLLIDPLENEDDLATIINSLIDQLKAPFMIEGFEILTSASIGVSIYPEHGQGYETLRRNADSAMYQIKSGTKGGAVIFDLQIGQKITDRMKLEQRLRLAVRDGRFRCAFQPKVDIQTQEVVGVEALIRLLDEDGVLQAPGSFIDLAVELGLIDNLAHMALDQIINSIDVLNDAFGPQATISINVAAKQATDVDFMRSFIETMKETNYAERFMIEVTEDAFVARSRFQSEVLPLLREIGGARFDRRFWNGLFLVVGACRDHRRRNQDRPIFHHRHSSARAQPKRAQSDRVARRRAWNDGYRRGRRNLRGACLSADDDPDSLRPRLLFRATFVLRGLCAYAPRARHVPQSPAGNAKPATGSFQIPLEHDPEKLHDFSDKIMRRNKAVRAESDSI